MLYVNTLVGSLAGYSKTFETDERQTCARQNKVTRFNKTQSYTIQQKTAKSFDSPQKETTHAAKQLPPQNSNQ